MTGNVVRLFSLIAFVIVALVLWGHFGFVASLAEAQFHSKLRELAGAGAVKIDLGAIMEGDWDMVCPSDGLDGGVMVSRYKRFYKPEGKPEAGHWGLIFIAADGTFKPVTGDDSEARFDLGGCAERRKAILYRNNKVPAVYSLRPEARAIGVKFP